MELKVAEGKASPKRELKLLRARNQKTSRSNLLEAIAQVNGGRSVVSGVDDDGVMRMKIVVKRQDLKQVLEVMKSGNKNSASQSSFLPSPSPLPSPSTSLEQRLILMRKRHILRANQVKGSRPSSWRPVLQSIPEEL